MEFLFVWVRGFVPGFISRHFVASSRYLTAEGKYAVKRVKKKKWCHTHCTPDLRNHSGHWSDVLLYRVAPNQHEVCCSRLTVKSRLCVVSVRRHLTDTRSLASVNSPRWLHIIRTFRSAMTLYCLYRNNKDFFVNKSFLITVHKPPLKHILTSLIGPD